MKINLDFSMLNRVMEAIDAEHITVPLKPPRLDPLEEIRIKIVKGIEIDISDVGINEGGLLNYKGFHVLLYIRNARSRIDDVISGNFTYKFHVADCKTIERMKIENRFQRYVVSQNTTGIFTFSGISRGVEKEIDIKVYVCRNCLAKLNYKNFNSKQWKDKNTIVNNFDINEFFATYSSYFSELPDFAIHDNHADYGPNWKNISNKIRNKYNWICQKCNVDLSSNKHRYLLDVHHVNGVIGDNRENNLQTLCKDCHSKIFLHNTIYVSRKDRQIISHLRNKQSNSNKNVLSGYKSSDWDEVEKLVDPALLGLIYQMKQKNYLKPITGYELLKNGEVVSEPVELAWEDKKLAIVLEKGNDTFQLFKKNGWSLLTPSEAMSKWFGL